jgi:hypothetical protein
MVVETPPKATPEYHMPEAPVTVLVLARRARSFEQLLKMTLDGTERLSYATWYEDTGSGEARGLPALSAPPTAKWLEEKDVKVVLLDQLDPDALPMPFWEAVAERVRRGVTGLLFHAGWPYGASNEAQTAVPALSHPVLGPLLPVERADELVGDPVPGAFAEPRPLRITRSGRQHPASRLVDDPDTSGDLWVRAAEGPHGWRTRFVYPVRQTRAGAEVLVEVPAAGAEAWPAVVASDSPRVLWVGIEDLEHDAYRDAVSQGRFSTLMNHWVLWLAGQTL